jgi:hypothetical protein
MHSERFHPGDLARLKDVDGLASCPARQEQRSMRQDANPERRGIRAETRQSMRRRMVFVINQRAMFEFVVAQASLRAPAQGRRSSRRCSLEPTKITVERSGLQHPRPSESAPRHSGL